MSGAVDDFKRAVEPHAALLYSYIRRRVGENDAADVLQETMLSAWKRTLRGGLPPDGEVCAFLLGVARNKIADSHRAAYAHAAADLDALSEALPDGDDSIQSASEALDVADAVSRLKPADRELCRMYYAGGMSLAEISVATATPVGTVKSRMFAVRAALRKILGGEDNG